MNLRDHSMLASAERAQYPAQARFTQGLNMGTITPHAVLPLQEQQIGAEEYEALCKGIRNLTPPPITDELSRWVNETQWSALQPLTQIPVSPFTAVMQTPHLQTALAQQL